MLSLLLVLTASAGDPKIGEVLAGLAGCEGCHTEEGGKPFAGGYPVETPFGTFYGPNITPDATGIKGWTEADFVKAMRQGVSPENKSYWPTFPYPAYTQMTDEDLGHLWAYMQTIEPVANEVRAHDMRKTRFELGVWRRLGFTEGGRSWEIETGEHARGAYLANAVAHCGECHTPRNMIGIPKSDLQFKGHEDPPEPSPPITKQELGWSVSEFVSFLEDGWAPDGDVVGGQMGHIIRDGTAKLSAEDRRALVEYILSR
ncbi:MAG: c-type cytochrome [Deltaproteobacteria bacterium]|nr:MAG: c-type cytochrome [Deltaproteobacteria bacterium]